MFGRFFNWLFRKEIAATKNVFSDASCSYCESRGFYQYSIDEVAVYSCTHCRNAFTLPRNICTLSDADQALPEKQNTPLGAL